MASAVVGYFRLLHIFVFEIRGQQEKTMGRPTSQIDALCVIVTAAAGFTIHPFGARLRVADRLATGFRVHLT